jgi:hypothetical protein
MELMSIINIIPVFLKIGLFTLMFSLINSACVEKIELHKEDKVKHALKINYALILCYFIISSIMYILMTWRVLVLIFFSTCLIGLIGIQNMRPDLLEFLSPINKNGTVKFICKVLISIYKILNTIYDPAIAIFKNTIIPLFKKVINIENNSDIIENFENFKSLCKLDKFKNLTSKMSSLENYLLSSKNCETNENSKNEESSEILKSNFRDNTTEEIYESESSKNK